MSSSPPQSLPTVLVQGLQTSPRLFADQFPVLWGFGPVLMAGRTLEPTMAQIARRILADAPPRFALAGLSMGGYLALEILRQAPERVAKLALLDTTARPDAPEQKEVREALIALAEQGRLTEVADRLYPRMVHPDRLSDAALKAVVDRMAIETGAEAFILQERAIMARDDYRPHLSAIACPTLVLVGDADLVTPPDRAREMADAIPGATLTVVERCGHLSTLEQPEAVNAALQAWMAA